MKMRVIFQKTNDTLVGVEILNVGGNFLFWRYLGESRIFKLDNSHNIIEYFTDGFGWKFMGKIDN
jgi:hypothetical protein